MNKNDTVAIIRSLLSSTNSSYSIYNLNEDFKNETGINIPLFGYNNISDFLSSIPETVKMTGIYPIQRISLVTNQKSAHIVSLVKRQKSAGQKKIPFSKSKHLNTKTAVDIRSQDFQEIQIEKKDFWDSKGQNKDFKIKTFAKVKEGPPINLDLTLSLNPSERLIPLKYFCCTEKIIPPINVELHARVGEYIEVCICQIFSPYKFYFHFRKFKKKFENFFEKLQIFYSTHAIPTIKKEFIRPKQVCAVFYKIFVKPEWHRVEIQKIINDSQIIVNFIDCGYITNISVEKLKLLHRNFTSLPKQAVLGILANIRPLEGESKWSLCAIKKFYDLAFRKALVAGVVEMDSKACWMKVALSCTKNSEIHINDTLVKEGHAEFNIDVSDNHFTDILKRMNLFSKAIEDFTSHKSVSHENMNNNERFAKNYLNSMQNSIKPILRTPIYFSSDYYNNNNNRLKKMFSLVKEE